MMAEGRFVSRVSRPGWLWKALFASVLIHFGLLLSLPDYWLGEPRRQQYLVGNIASPNRAVSPENIPNPPMRAAEQANPVASELPPPRVKTKRSAPRVNRELEPAPGATQNSSLEAGVREEDIRRYRWLIVRQLHPVSSYPNSTATAGQEGRVTVRVRYLALQPPRVDISISSGQMELDQVALTMVRQAVLKLMLPPEMAGRTFEITLPFEFGLKD